MELFEHLRVFLTQCHEAILLLRLHPEYLEIRVQCQCLPLQARCRVTNKGWVHIEYVKLDDDPRALFSIENCDLNQLCELFHDTAGI